MKIEQSLVESNPAILLEWQVPALESFSIEAATHMPLSKMGATYDGDGFADS